MIDLGKTMGHNCCPEITTASKGEKYYPSLYIDDVGDVDLPVGGKAVIKYKITRDTKDRVKGTREIVIEVHGIKPMDEEEESEESLDKLRLELTGE